MNRFTEKLLRTALVAVFLTTLGAGFAQAQFEFPNNTPPNCSGTGRPDSRLTVIALTRSQQLVCFFEFTPGNTTTIGTVSGLTGGDTVLVGIDFRVQDGNLYGVGNAGGIYILSRTTAAATFVNRLTIALDGTFFGVDFNPAADRLRVVSDTGQNLRHNVNAGGTTVNDGTLSYTAPAMDTALGVTGSAYTNNDLDPNTSVTLHALDTTLDQIAIQSPANNGTLANVGKLTVDTSGSVGFDIYSTIRGGTTVNVEGFASLTLGDGSIQFYSIVIFTGKATSRGSFSPQTPVIDIAVPLFQR